MSRRFRLQTLERLRAARLHAAAGELAAARVRLAQAEAQVASLVEAALRCVPAARATPAEVQLAADRRLALRDGADRARDHVEECRRQVDRATAAWHTARAGLRAVESLHERHRQALAERDARAEQRLVDDLAGSGAPQRGGEPA